MKTHFINFNL